jgi:hypothetical protein
METIVKRNLTSGPAAAPALIAFQLLRARIPSTRGGTQQFLASIPARGSVNPVRFGGGGGHSFGGGYGFMGGDGFHHGHHFRAGFGVIGVPYFSYDDEGCWWSRRYHRWICMRAPRSANAGRQLRPTSGLPKSLRGHC